MADNHDDDYAMGMELFDGDVDSLLAAAPPPAPTSHLEPHLLESFPPLEPVSYTHLTLPTKA